MYSYIKISLSLNLDRFHNRRSFATPTTSRPSLCHRPRVSFFPQTSCLRSNIDSIRWIMTIRSEEHTSELQSLMRISYAVFCLKKTNTEYTIIRSKLQHNTKKIQLT